MVVHLRARVRARAVVRVRVCACVGRGARARGSRNEVTCARGRGCVPWATRAEKLGVQ